MGARSSRAGRPGVTAPRAPLFGETDSTPRPRRAQRTTCRHTACGGQRVHAATCCLRVAPVPASPHGVWLRGRIRGGLVRTSRLPCPVSRDPVPGRGVLAAVLSRNELDTRGRDGPPAGEDVGGPCLEHV